AAQLGAGSSLPSVPSERVSPRRRAPGSESGPAGGFGSDHSATPAPGVGPDATPSTERTERLSPVADRASRSDSPTSHPRRPAVRPTGGDSGSRPSSGAPRQPQVRPGAAATAGSAVTSDRSARPESAKPEAPVTTGGAAASATTGASDKTDKP